jgi:nucleoside 2-deoxyribosyltransferase
MSDVMSAAKQVFMSYARDDEAVAERLRRVLNQAGYAVLDPNALIAYGENFADAVLAAVRESDALVFVVPQREGLGKWALFEAGAAKALGKQIIAVLPDPVRYANGSIGSDLSGTALIDASRLSDAALASSIASALH